MARAFGRAGASLALCDLREDDLAALAGSLHGADVLSAVVDVACEDQVARWCRDVGQSFAGLDVLVNTVGVVDNMGDVEELSTEMWDRSLKVNLTSAFLMAKHCMPLLRRRGGGVIVNTSSVSGMANQAGAMVYSVTKAGLISLTKSEAIDLARYGVRAVAICPGSVSTPLVDRAVELMAERKGKTTTEQRREWESQYPTGRFSTPEEVAELAVFLSSSRAANITGASIVIDGGLTAVLSER
jgi:NAD(P)-dependent dehydrogenase (short-subunit alcohol dehydrogenase family)